MFQRRAAEEAKARILSAPGQAPCRRGGLSRRFRLPVPPSGSVHWFRPLVPSTGHGPTDMRSIRFKILLLVVFALGACGGGPEVIGGGENTVSIRAGPLANVSGFAERYCQDYGKRAVALGDKPLGPSTTKRLYAYNCVNPADPHH